MFFSRLHVSNWVRAGVPVAISVHKQAKRELKSGWWVLHEYTSVCKQKYQCWTAPVQRETRRERAAQSTGWRSTRPRRAPRWRAPARDAERETCRSLLLFLRANVHALLVRCDMWALALGRCNSKNEKRRTQSCCPVRTDRIRWCSGSGSGQASRVRVRRVERRAHRSDASARA